MTEAKCPSCASPLVSGQFFSALFSLFFTSKDPLDSSAVSIVGGALVFFTFLSFFLFLSFSYHSLAVPSDFMISSIFWTFQWHRLTINTQSQYFRITRNIKLIQYKNIVHANFNKVSSKTNLNILIESDLFYI